MKKKSYIFYLFIMSFIILCSSIGFRADASEKKNDAQHALHREMTQLKKSLPDNITRFQFEPKYDFPYPDAVRGIYVTGHSAGGNNFNHLIQLVENSDLNSMVIDVKDDWGNLTYIPDKNAPFSDISQNYIKDLDGLLKTLEDKKIYPIARIVVFKDSVLAKKKPEWSFKEGNRVWENNRGESFVNPFLKEVWDYNIEIAIDAAKRGFREIQFDYVRFPEGFERRDQDLIYQLGNYEQIDMDNVQKRVNAVTDFVAYAREKLKPYGVKMSVDIFGYTATIPEAPGIGQNFMKISDNVDIISSMIYPSHWTSYFGIIKPDLEPYKLVEEYIKVEKRKLEQLEHPPISRPWLQDFTATWLGEGNYKPYGKKEIEDQIRALQNNGVYEFLLWNAANVYTPNVDYTPQ